MNRPTSTPGSPFRTVGLLFLAGLLVVALPASAQVVEVTSVVPSQTEQGTIGVVVTIGGLNFTKGSQVAFYVTGTTNPGGVAVKSVRYKNTKTLEATIDVASDAQTQLKFDVQVMSNGRTGKGTELFKVIEKVTGGDLTPPGTITDLQAGETTFGSALLAWTAPADDGYFDGGPATKYDLRVRKADCGAYTMDIWIDDGMTGIKADPCHMAYGRPVAGPVGSTELGTVSYLAPNTEYIAALRAVDDSLQGPNWSALPPPTYQARFTTTGFPPVGWSAPWAATVVDACPPTSTTCSLLPPPRLDLDPAGQPAVFYVKQRVPILGSFSGGSWALETLPIAIDNDYWAYDFAFDPANGQATVASAVPNTNPSKSQLRFYRRTGATWTAETVGLGLMRDVVLRMGPAAPGAWVPTIAFRYEKSGVSQLKVARKIDGAWSVEIVASGATGAADKPLALAFDGDGNPAVTFPQSTGADQLAFALRRDGAWTTELPDSNPPGAPWVRVAETQVAFDPSRGDFLAAVRYLDPESSDSVVRLCERTGAAWSCEELFRGRVGIGLPLALGTDGKVFFAPWRASIGLLMTIRDPFTRAWSAEYVDWNVKGNYVSALKIGPDGEPVVAFNALHGSSRAGGSDGNFAIGFARRTP